MSSGLWLWTVIDTSKAGDALEHHMAALTLVGRAALPAPGSASGQEGCNKQTSLVCIVGCNDPVANPLTNSSASPVI